MTVTGSGEGALAGPMSGSGPPHLKRNVSVLNMKQGLLVGVALALQLAAASQSLAEDTSTSEQARPEAGVEGKKPAHQEHSNISSSFAYAMYVEDWQRKIERLGNLNLPEEVREQSLTGKVTLNVAIESTGALQSVNLLRSSGSKLLDDTAVAIVRRAAPFPPFPPELRAETGILHITRAWVFGSHSGNNPPGTASPSPKAGARSGAQK